MQRPSDEPTNAFRLWSEHFQCTVITENNLLVQLSSYGLCQHTVK